MGPETLAGRIGKPICLARDLIRAHEVAYHTFWKWAGRAVNSVMLGESLPAAFGWQLHPSADPNPRSILNYPMQANGAEMMQIASCMATEAGIELCAPVHDALLIAAPVELIEQQAERMCSIMQEASRAVLAGFELGADAKEVRYPRTVHGRGAGPRNVK